MTAIALGNVHLGYIVIETDKFADWRRFGRDAIGIHLDETLSNAMRFRLDDNECRFLLQRGPAEDVTALGWQLDDHSTFDEIVTRVARHGVPIVEGTAEETALRGVERLVRFPGPNGLAQEIFTQARTSDTPLNMPVGGGFVTGEAGLGHVAITTKKPHEMRGYYNTVFDARLSDYIDETISGVKLKIRFLRVNQRHHSLAIAAVNRLPVNPIRTRIQHVNIQVAELDDMTASYERVKELGFRMALGVGQHTNDRQLTYYAITPSGFEWEVGWNPIVVDENTWEPGTYQGISIWGHTPEGRTIIDQLAQFKTGARSLLRGEDSVPALAGTGIPDDWFKEPTMLRIDTHHHLIPADYRKALRRAGIDEAGGRALPDWSPEGSLQTMRELNVATAILSVSTPGTTFLPDAADAASLARDLNDYTADLVASQPDQFGFFATVPMPHIGAAVAETVRALDDLKADGVVLLANSARIYLGQDGQDPLFTALNERSAVVFIHPAELPGPTVPGVAPFAADFLLDTTRATYLLVRNGIRSRYPNIRFILSHAGGFVPYASHRMAVAITADTGRSPADILDDFSSFYFDTALSSSAAALPTLLAFARPGHITFGSDWPFAPVAAGKLFAAGLETYPGTDADTRSAIERTNALALFPRLGTPPQPIPQSPTQRIHHGVSRAVMRGVARLMSSA